MIVGLSFVIGVLVGYFGSGDSSNGHTQMLSPLVIDQVYSNILFTIILINIVWQQSNWHFISPDNKDNQIAKGYEELFK